MHHAVNRLPASHCVVSADYDVNQEVLLLLHALYTVCLFVTQTDYFIVIIFLLTVQSKLSFIFGKIGRIGLYIRRSYSMLKSKCIPVLLYDLDHDVCPLNVSDRSLDFVINRFFMKLLIQI